MNWPHWIVMPVVAPLMAGALVVLLERRSVALARAVAIATAIGLAALAAALATQAADGTVRAYLLGNWAAPFGISLALDRLAALMLVLTSIVGLAGLLYAGAGDAARGAHFHSLLLFQLAGLNGAFLTADLFNLFVFFEVLLIASYGLLLHGGGAARLRAAIHYVAFNLTGSALFLVAVSLLYGLTGTLNMADLAGRVAAAPEADAVLLRVAAMLLLVVFCVKAALLPLYFWLPETYSAASAPAAALFAIMTKVGVYAIARVTTLVFGADAGVASSIAQPWLAALALATLALGAAGALSANRMRLLVAYLIVASAGTLLMAVGLGTPGTLGAGLFYLINSTLVAAAMFLLVDRIALGRGALGDALVPAPQGARRALLGSAYFLFAVALAGVPPLAGFLGKALLLAAARETAMAAWVWVVTLAAGLAIIVALARAGATLFWRGGDADDEPDADAEADAPAHARADATTDARAGAGGRGATPATANASAGVGGRTAAAGPALAIGLLGALTLAGALLAGPLASYTGATAAQLFERRPYIDAVLGQRPAPAMLDVRKEMREQGRLKGSAK